MGVALENDGYESEVISAREKKMFLVKKQKEGPLLPLQTDLLGRKCSEKDSRRLYGKGILELRFNRERLLSRMTRTPGFLSR